MEKANEVVLTRPKEGLIVRPHPAVPAQMNQTDQFEPENLLIQLSHSAPGLRNPMKIVALNAS